MKNNKEFNLENKFDKFIFGLIERRENGDWDVYENGDLIEYVFDLREEEWIDLNFDFESLEKYIGEGIYYGDGYSVKLKDYKMIVEIIYEELD
jgi:hypothetical protein